MRSDARERDIPRAPGGHLDEDLCLDLLHGLLDADERRDVLDHVAACPTCERLLQVRAAARERLRARPVPDFVPVPGLRPAPRPATRPASPFAWLTGLFGAPPRRLAAGLAAAVVLALVLAGPAVRRDPVTGPLPWLPDLRGGMQVRSALASVADAELAAGLEAYAAHDVRGAIRLLLRAEAEGPLETIRRIYLGSALALDGQYLACVELLEPEATTDLPDPWGSEARWTLYVALRSAGRAARADSLLRVLRAEPGVAGDRARALAP